MRRFENQKSKNEESRKSKNEKRHATYRAPSTLPLGMQGLGRLHSYADTEREASTSNPVHLTPSPLGCASEAARRPDCWRCGARGPPRPPTPGWFMRLLVRTRDSTETPVMMAHEGTSLMAGSARSTGRGSPARATRPSTELVGDSGVQGRGGMGVGQVQGGDGGGGRW